MSFDLATLRRSLRRQRRQVSVYQQRQSEQQVLHQLKQLPAFKAAQHIGIYLDAFGEIHTKKIIQLCFQLQKNVYLPRICAMNQHLYWVRISANQLHARRFYLHRLGMFEPMQSRGKLVHQLDLLIMPLLACDATGTRLGMGGGYYDKTLSRAVTQPFRLGLAHEFQFIADKLARQAWDQPLDALLTPKKIRHFQRL